MHRIALPCPFAIRIWKRTDPCLVRTCIDLLMNQQTTNNFVTVCVQVAEGSHYWQSTGRRTWMELVWWSASVNNKSGAFPLKAIDQQFRSECCAHKLLKWISDFHWRQISTNGRPLRLTNAWRQVHSQGGRHHSHATSGNRAWFPSTFDGPKKPLGSTVTQANLFVESIKRFLDKLLNDKSL